MRGRVWIAMALVAAMAMTACKGEKKMAQYGEVYQERPATVCVWPVNDLALRRAVRERSDSAYNASIDVAARYLYLTAGDILKYKGYNVMGPLASAQIAASEGRTGRQMRNENINDMRDSLGIDALLFVDIIGWKQTATSWSVELEYKLRSTHSNGELMHVHVSATKVLPTDNKGRPLPLKGDLEFQKKMGISLETAQRCRLVEIVNNYVMNDMPTGTRARVREGERYDKSHPEYFSLRVNKDGTVEMMNSTEQ